MTFFYQAKTALKGYSVAFELIFKRKYLKFMLLPLLLNIIIFVLGTDIVFELADKAQTFITQKTAIAKQDFWGADILHGAMSGFVKILIYTAFLILFVYIGGYIIIILLSPVFAILSEKVEKEISETQIDFPFNTKQFIFDIFRGIAIALRNVIIETSLMILVFFVSFVPVIGWLGSLFMLFVSAYFFGFSYLDYTNERHKLNIRKSVKLMRKYKWVAIINGALFSISLIIPYCGIALSAFVAIISVTAATVSAAEIFKNEQNIQTTV